MTVIKRSKETSYLCTSHVRYKFVFTHARQLHTLQCFVIISVCKNNHKKITRVQLRTPTFDGRNIHVAVS